MAKDGKEQWVRAGWEALREGGASAVRVEALARKIGVTKGSFYHHFTGRDALLQALLEAWHQRGTEALIAQADQEGSPVARFEKLCAVVFEPGEHEPLEVVMRSWAAMDARAREVVEAVDARRLSYVEALLHEVGFSPEVASLRARMLYRVVIGDFMWRETGAHAMTLDERSELVRLMLSEERDLA